MHAFFLFLHEDTAALRLISDAKSFLGEQWCAWVFEQKGTGMRFLSFTRNQCSEIL